MNLWPNVTFKSDTPTSPGAFLSVPAAGGMAYGFIVGAAEPNRLPQFLVVAGPVGLQTPKVVGSLNGQRRLEFADYDVVFDLKDLRDGHRNDISSGALIFLEGNVYVYVVDREDNEFGYALPSGEFYGRLDGYRGFWVPRWKVTTRGAGEEPIVVCEIDTSIKTT